MTKPTKEQMKVESIFPAIAKYVRGYGYVEIGDQESFGFVVRALGYGGLDFEDDTPEALAEAMAVLEAGLSKWALLPTEWVEKVPVMASKPLDFQGFLLLLEVRNPA